MSRKLHLVRKCSNQPSRSIRAEHSTAPRQRSKFQQTQICGGTSFESIRRFSFARKCPLGLIRFYSTPVCDSTLIGSRSWLDYREPFSNYFDDGTNRLLIKH